MSGLSAIEQREAPVAVAVDEQLSTSARTLFSFRNFHVLILLLTGLVALFFVIESKRFLFASGENIYPESAGVVAAQRWAAGLPLYGDYRQPPYLLTPFPPLWYAFLYAGAKLGLSSLDSLTLLGRILSLATLFGSVLLGYSWNRRLGLSPGLSLLTPTFYLSLPILIPWAITARPDFPAIFFGFLAVYLVGLRSKPASIALAAVAAALAFLIRHNAVAAPIAIVLWLLWLRRWKGAALFCAIWSIVAGAVLLPFYHADRLLLLNLSGAKFGHFALSYARDILTRLLDRPGHGFALALFAFGAFGFLQAYRSKNQQLQLMNFYLGSSLLLAVVGSAAAGGAVNHYLEAALVLAVLIPVGMASLKHAWVSGSAQSVLAVVVILFLLLPSLDAERWNVMHRQPEDLRRPVRLVQNRTVFTDIPFLAARSSPAQLIDLASLINTQRVGGWAAWSSSRAAEKLRAKQYDFVILTRPVETSYLPVGLYPRAPRIDSQLQSAIGHNYQFCFELDETYVYVPAGSSTAAHSCPVIEGFHPSPPQMSAPSPAE